LQGGSVFLLATGKQMLFLRQEKDRMRKVIVSEMITLDGFFAGPDGEIDWHVVDEDFNERTLELFRSVDTLVFGRVTYELMAKYWPTEAAQTDDPLIAEKMNTLPKVVFSRTLEKAEWGEWRNVTVVKGNLEEEIAKLKQAPGKDLVICGSSEIVFVLARAGLIDDYLLYVTPVVLGSGIPLFQGMKERIKLQLVNVQHLRSGVVRLHYRSVNSR
jgi:dihydrofolate reductase